MGTKARKVVWPLSGSKTVAVHGKVYILRKK